MENLRGMALMTAAMACFAITDALIKVLATTHSQGQIVWVTGLAGMVLFALAALGTRQPIVTQDILAPAVLARIVAEALGTVAIVAALSRAPLSIVVAIMQSVPLIVTVAAALFLGEAVGWRRWAAIIAGLIGVLVILQPGADGFTSDALFAVVAAFALASRDVFTRLVPQSASTFQIGAWGFAGLIPAGLLLAEIGTSANGPFTPAALALFSFTALSTVLAIYFVIRAMRTGDVAVVSPFRYTRLIFGLAIAVLLFQERPDFTTWLGAAIVAAAGLYTLYRERRAVRVQAMR